ncbi:MAG: 2-C-methyl-D-erythritol 4-phosphate cytidylyltransferase [Bacteroidetes bacterium CG2_30_32_10]|nr:MAG: 2-C-methyl-D-erythritol 4-phosphate cytidylyltransferase [Bacteroidetes bacterium CG2_30_32_10]
MKKYVIIVAGGFGTRMNNSVPKQFLLLAGKPVLFHTINAFFSYNNEISIILVLPSSQISKWKELCDENHLTIPHNIVEGGETRFHSVKNGLKSIEEAGLIAIHDGVRPLVSNETISRVYNTAEKLGTAIPVLSVNDSIREISNKTNKSVNRNNLKIVQTPQCFKSEIINKAYQQSYNEMFTDDATVVEKTGEEIFLVDGNNENIKITTAIDLLIAENLIQQLTN